MNSFRISLESFRSFRGPLLHKAVTVHELSFVVSYSKSALVRNVIEREIKKEKVQMKPPYIVERHNSSLSAVGTLLGKQATVTQWQLHFYYNSQGRREGLNF